MSAFDLKRTSGRRRVQGFIFLIFSNLDSLNPGSILTRSDFFAQREANKSSSNKVF
jgi:hypothetical protein